MSKFAKSMMVFAILVPSLFALSGCGETKPQKHQVVIQVSSADPVAQKIALNNAVNLQKALGPDNVDVEIVAYGPGLALLTKKSKNSKRVESLALSDVRFSACGNTMKAVKKKTGKNVALSSGVKVVPGGVVRIDELQRAGYSYIRP